MSLSPFSGYPCPRFKLVILDEADTMTTDAQAALRRIIENYSKVTRFVLLCNYVTRLIEPLASRCIKFRFQFLPSISVQSRLRWIVEQEKVRIEEDTLQYLITKGQGDMRRTIGVLQLAHSLTLGRALVTPALVDEITGEVPDAVVTRVWKVLAQESQYNYERITELVDELSLDGYSLATLLERLLSDLLQRYDQTDALFADLLTDAKLALICEKMAEIEQRLLDGSTEYLQFLDLLSYISRVLHGKVA